LIIHFGPCVAEIFEKFHLMSLHDYNYLADYEQAIKPSKIFNKNKRGLIRTAYHTIIKEICHAT
jgi:hypothetical protein